jgi:hypothetical protein
LHHETTIGVYVDEAVAVVVQARSFDDGTHGAVVDAIDLAVVILMRVALEHGQHLA